MRATNPLALASGAAALCAAALSGLLLSGPQQPTLARHATPPGPHSVQPAQTSAPGSSWSPTPADVPQTNASPPSTRTAPSAEAAPAPATLQTLLAPPTTETPASPPPASAERTTVRPDPTPASAAGWSSAPEWDQALALADQETYQQRRIEHLEQRETSRRQVTRLRRDLGIEDHHQAARGLEDLLAQPVELFPLGDAGDEARDLERILSADR